MPKQYISFLLLIFMMCSNAFSQISSGGRPLSLKKDIPLLNAREIIAKPAFDRRPVLKSSNMSPKFKTLTFAIPIKTNYTPTNSGELSVLEDGTKLWRLLIQSKEAASLNLIFTHYELPEGGKLFIYSPDGSQVQGAYTSANNKSTGILPTMPILGDQLIVEYSEPANAEFSANLEIGQVNYDFIGINNALGIIELGDFLASDSCHREASCFADWGIEDQGVVKIIVSGTELCSGSLIANTSKDNTPYVLSAAHCFQDYGYQSSTALFIFNYECPNCMSGIEGTREQSIAGGYMRAYSETGENKNIDYALIEMSLPPPPSYDAFFCGWDIRDLKRTESATIHHPSGDVKKLSLDHDSLRIVTLVVEGEPVFFPQGHWRVLNWEIGSTEGGSSGAPLFNIDHRIIGGLSAGSATCSSPIDDFFFRLSMAWENHGDRNQQLKYWLDPDNTGLTFIDGYEPSYAARTNLYSNVQLGESLGVVTFNEANGKGYQTGDNTTTIRTYAEHFAIEDSFKVHGFYFVPFLGKNSALTPITFKIWDGDAKPENELWSQKLSLREWVRRQYVDKTNFGTSGGYYNKTIYDDKECFINIPEPIVGIDNLFIGYEMSVNAPQDTFAMYQVLERTSSEENTAFFYQNDAWHPFTDYPVKALNTSLWISAVIELTSVTTDTTPPITPKKKLIRSIVTFPSSSTVWLHEEAKEDILIEGFSSNGSKVLDKILPAGNINADLNFSKSTSGVFILRFTQNKISETYKVVVLPH